MLQLISHKTLYFPSIVSIVTSTIHLAEYSNLHHLQHYLLHAHVRNASFLFLVEVFLCQVHRVLHCSILEYLLCLALLLDILTQESLGVVFAENYECRSLLLVTICAMYLGWMPYSRRKSAYSVWLPKSLKSGGKHQISSNSSLKYVHALPTYSKAYLVVISGSTLDFLAMFKVLLALLALSGIANAFTTTSMHSHTRIKHHSSLRMLTIEQEESTIMTPTGPMRSVVLRPNAPGKYPGIVFYSEIFQLTGPILRSAQMFAGHGFVVLVPEIYHSTSPGYIHMVSFTLLRLNLLHITSLHFTCFLSIHST